MLALKKMQVEHEYEERERIFDCASNCNIIQDSRRVEDVRQWRPYKLRKRFLLPLSLSLSLSLLLYLGRVIKFYGKFICKWVETETATLRDGGIRKRISNGGK